VPGETSRPPTASGDDDPASARSGLRPDKGPAGSSGAQRGGSSSDSAHPPQLVPEVQREIERILDQLQAESDSRSADPSQLLDFLLGP
jgi:hypothetical protein